jgi:lipopolysaccharide transport protein LptA
MTACLMLALLGRPSAAGDGNESEPSEIRITAEELVAELEGNLVEFRGRVQAVQAGTTLDADRLQVYRRADLKSNPEMKLETEAIEKIVADGRVRIRSDGLEIHAERAVYDPNTDEVVFSGRPVRWQHRDQRLSAGQVVFNRRMGNLQAIAGDSERVRVEVRLGALR